MFLSCLPPRLASYRYGVPWRVSIPNHANYVKFQIRFLCQNMPFLEHRDHWIWYFRIKHRSITGKKAPETVEVISNCNWRRDKWKARLSWVKVPSFHHMFYLDLQGRLPITIERNFLEFNSNRIFIRILEYAYKKFFDPSVLLAH